MPPIVPNQLRSTLLVRMAARAVVVGLLTLRAAAALSLQPGEAFFTNVADRLLQQQLGMRLTEIQIAPTNQYSPEVHRLMQVTANVYDATSVHPYPTVFRPLFETRSNGVFLAGFTNDNRVNTLRYWFDSNVYGVPLVIAARKDFPNFNEFANTVQFTVARYLEVTRATTNQPPNGTNVMYALSISNSSAVELWNSYQAAYPRCYDFSFQFLHRDDDEPVGRNSAERITAHWLGRVHRGTPWQTIYLQADVAPH